MRLQRLQRIAPWVLLPTLLTLSAFTYFCGPLDHIPRLHASAQSPDGTLTVKVYRQTVSFTRPEYDVIAKVFDRRGNLVYERKIYQESMWSELDNLYRNITFEGDEIHIGPKFSADEYFVIKRSELRSTV
jgi:hypothetical protein